MQSSKFQQGILPKRTAMAFSDLQSFRPGRQWPELRRDQQIHDLWAMQLYISESAMDLYAVVPQACNSKSVWETQTKMSLSIWVKNNPPHWNMTKRTCEQCHCNWRDNKDPRWPPRIAPWLFNSFHRKAVVRCKEERKSGGEGEISKRPITSSKWIQQRNWSLIWLISML